MGKRRPKPAGATTRDGWGWQHQKLRADWAKRVNAGEVDCWRCRRWIPPRSDWHLGHDDNDRSIWRGPECKRCNLGAAARKTNTIRRLKARGRPVRRIEPNSRRW